MAVAAAKADLARRRLLATHDQIVRGVLATQVLEWLWERGGEPGAGSRAPSGVAPFASVSAVAFIDSLEEALDPLARAGVPPEELYDGIGRRAVRAVAAATIGRTFASMANGDPLRLFESLGSGPSILVAFGERRVVSAVPREVRIAFTGSLLPPRIFGGMYAAMAEGVGGREVGVACSEPVLGDSEYVVTWR